MQKLLLKLAKFLLIGSLVIISCVTIAAAGAYIYLVKPYEEVTIARAANAPQKIQVIWYRECGESFYQASNDLVYEITVPKSGKTPEDFIDLVPGNSFLITGYPYKELHKNIFTHNITEQHSKHFDTIEWQAITPYMVYTKDNEQIKSNASLAWKSDSQNPIFIAHTEQNSKGGC
jgi:hypothetical protein